MDSRSKQPGVCTDAAELIQLRLSVSGLKLDSRRRAAAPQAGPRESRLRGRGVDFLESRGYQAGDDIRHMDWRVTARTGQPHTKVFQEERERPVIVVVDYNPSMFFGTKVAFKSVVAARVAALIGWAAVRNGDRIGAFLFGAGSHQELSPSGGRRGALTLIHNLLRWDSFISTPAQQQSDAPSYFSEALLRLRRVARPGSLVFLISDFYALDSDADHHLARLRQHNDIVACQIVDALEQAPPPPGRYGISDGLHLRVLDTHSPLARVSYQDFFTRHHAQVWDMLRKRDIPLIRLATYDDIAAELRRGLAGAHPIPL